MNQRPIVYAVRDFPPGCGTPSDGSHPADTLKRPRTSDVVPRVAPTKPRGPCFEQELAFRNHDAPPKPNGTTTSLPQQQPGFPNSVPHLLVADSKGKGICIEQEPPDMVTYTAQHLPTPRDRVFAALAHFKQVFNQLSRDKEARRGGDLFDATARIDIKTLDVLEKTGKRVNIDKRIGSVPGIEVGDEYQYKTELRLVGLHSKPMCGIDYMNIGDFKLATSIVASDGYGYDDKFGSDVVVYTGEGGNVISKEKQTEDQKLVKGNLALANSMRRKSEVRVIRGEERLDRKGKRYVYDGLYLVNEYWLEKIRGKSVYKFKLCRIP